MFSCVLYLSECTVAKLEDRIEGCSLHSTTQTDKNHETLSLVWLNDSINAQQKLPTTTDHLQTFNAACKCKKNIKSVTKDGRVTLIVSDGFGREAVSRIHHLRHVISIYVYAKEQIKDEQ